MGDAAFCNDIAQERVDKAKRLLQKIGSLEDPQVALKLQLHTTIFGKVVFASKTTPAGHTGSVLSLFDDAQKDCLEAILCGPLFYQQWRQASRGLTLGGLGPWQALKHAPAAYLTSRTSSGRQVVPEIPSRTP